MRPKFRLAILVAIAIAAGIAIACSRPSDEALPTALDWDNGSWDTANWK